MPVILYSLPLLHWTKADVAGLDHLLRHQLVSCQAHHPRASSLRLYLPRREGGRGFLSIETLAHRGEVRLARYMSCNQDTPLIGILRAHQLSLPPTRSIHHRAMKFLEELGVALPVAIKSSVRLAISRRDMSELQDRPLQGQFWRRLNGSGLDASLPLAWLSSPSLRREAEGTIVAAQEQMLATRNFSARISRQIPVADDLCRRCGAPGETLDHLLGCCPALARTSYITRHDSVVRALHWGICKGHGWPELAASPGRHRLEPLVVLPMALSCFGRLPYRPPATCLQICPTLSLGRGPRCSWWTSVFRWTPTSPLRHRRSGPNTSRSAKRFADCGVSGHVRSFQSSWVHWVAYTVMPRSCSKNCAP